MTERQIWMVGTAPDGKGGIATVIRQYQQAGLFENGAMRFLASHHDRSSLGRVLPFIQACWSLWLAMCMQRVSLVHAHTSHNGSFWRKLVLLWPALLLKVPVVVHLHGSDFETFYADGSRWRQACIRYLFRRSFRVLALSKEWRSWVLKVEPQATVDIVFNSLSAQRNGNSATTLPIQPAVLFLGRIGDRKGTFDLLNAFAIVFQRIPDARLLVGGDGEVEKLQAETLRLGLSQAVHYVGWVNAEQKEELFKRAWVFALPSYYEGLPMAILEAMARSRAVVSCPVGGIAEAVEHEVSGRLVQPGNVNELAETLTLMLSDRDLAHRLGQNGRLAFEAKFSNDANLPTLLNIYRQAGVKKLPLLKTDSTSSLKTGLS
ncbi:glycosyltransferase family 4 protein [Paucibacter sp. Y2R2-4]|uniref:glycosyltransferase family 4 protein n=1 Tax=Paucibacter sp. Y2R2-4 TaxID=2893553 RepID=UPI0021E4AB41|nr:glycosyltransferase family 4 protein [Paucibacter sp. Y2R2-4]MCV2349260.1 glycosyltransferase family 4 protein [Paucibacter sp. Y2R2-4]